ncbi:MAG: FAD-dependent oxidoreductase [Thalassobaculaceae bacterium]|nr:FAD-dependent oxidoreductase [Thalassobaculaceae bacterium]
MAIGEADVNRDYDVIVLGAGAAGMTAAVVAAHEGLDVLLLDKTDRIGGTAAISGGMVWAPGSGPAKRAGKSDSLDDARTYLQAVIGNHGNATLRETFLTRAAEAIDYLDRNTSVRLVPLSFYPDYYPDLPGASRGGRVLEPLAFDARTLGAAFPLLRAPLPEFTLFGGMMIARPDIPHFRRVLRSPRSALRVARLVGRYLRQRLSLHRGADLVLGNALAGRLMKSLIDLGVSVRLGAAAGGLMIEDGRVCGAEIAVGSDTHAVRARRGVVLATGGFSHDAALRGALLPAKAGGKSAVPLGNSGDGVTLGRTGGGHIPEGNAGGAFWVPVSTFTRHTGEQAIYPHTVTDRGKPGMMAVARDGRRFTNESNSYHEFVQAMFRADDTQGTIPCHLICDADALWRYGLGAVKPMTLRLSPYLKCGYLVSAPTLSDLAERLGIDTAGLVATVARYNADSETGVDTAFGRGGNDYHRYVGDPENRPNPCMRPLVKPPYYAVALYPGDLGTASGLEVDGNGRVLDGAAVPVPGLYACGNDMNSVMAGAYPGPGITLGPALVFGYLVGRHLSGRG